MPGEPFQPGLYSFLTPDIVGCFAVSDFTAVDLYFSDKPVFVFLSFHESDLLSMAPLIKFICESLVDVLPRHKCRGFHLRIPLAHRGLG
jgi:hypothetical protein